MAEIAAERSIIRLSYIFAAIAALAIAALAVAYEHQGRVVHRQEERTDVYRTASVVRSQLQGELDGYIQLPESLVVILEYRPDLGEADFERLAARFMSGHAGIRAIAAAPDAVIAMVHPPDGQFLIGRDQLALEGERRATLMARALGTTVVSGPLDLGAGGRGFIVRTPVFIDGDDGGRTFWGIVGMAVDATALFTEGGLLDPALNLELAVVAREGVAGQGAIFGDAAVLDRDPVLAEIALPTGRWTLAAVPKGGWTEPNPWPPRLAFALAALLVAAPIVGAGRLVASRQARLAETRAREAEFSRLSWRLEFALAASNVGVWDVDIATDRLHWDERARVLFGLPERDGPFGEADWIGAIHPDDRARALAEAREAAAGTERFVSRYRIVRPDGEIRHIRDIAGTYVDPHGARRMIGLMWDETDDVARQEELDGRRREAEAATEAKSRFLAAMSHEIRTPMTGVLGLLGLMLDEPLPEGQRERATIALGSARSLLEILNDILDFSKLEAGGLRVVGEAVDPRALVAEVVELMAPCAESKGLVLRHAIAPDVPALVETDPVRLRQVLTNLLSNATKFTDAGEVAVRVGYAPTADGAGRLTVEVEDTGVGIEPDHQERIFEQFVQVDTSLARRVGGTGLGLAICRQIVERMGGRMTLRSVPGMGSLFAFTVPVPAPASGAPAGPAVGDAPAAERAERSLRVLLAEDNPTNRYLITAYLRAGGHAVETAANGTEAVAAAGRGGFDAILMDVQMPEIDGLEATRRIRALEGAAGRVPIVALTANAMARDRDACFAAGMTDYLAKPIDVPALHRVLARVGRTDAAPHAPVRSAAAI